MNSTAAIPLVSVIVPNYNHARFLPERLASIRNQTFQDYELIVLDDASTDASLSIIRSELAGFPYQLIENECNSGSPCSQWLKGILQARGRYLWIAESDDSCSADFLANRVHSMQQGASLTYCRSRPIDELGQAIPGMTYWPDNFDAHQWRIDFTIPSDQFCKRYLINANMIPNASAAIMDRSTALSCVSIRTRLQTFRSLGDWLFWMHYLASSNGPVSFSQAEDSWYRYHPSTTRAISSSKQKEIRQVQEFGRVISLISNYPTLKQQTSWLTRALDPGWDWIYIQSIHRLQPNLIERLSALYLSGPLALALPMRLISSDRLRRYFFPGVYGWINRWQTFKANFKHSLKLRLHSIRDPKK
jgi:glycosyltransferase involved in cell wall biosynthesis